MNGTNMNGAGPAPAAGKYESTFLGVLTARAPHVPDVATVLNPPAGRTVVVTKAELVVRAPVAADWRQHTFFFTRFVRITQDDGTLFNPNLDFLCTVPLRPGTTGTFVGAGGVGPSPNPEWNWTPWTQPLQLNSGLEVIFGCDLAVGNSVELHLEWADGGPGTSVVKWARDRAGGTEHLLSVGPPPPGKRWYIHNAYLRAVVSAGTGPRAAQAVRRSDRFLLCAISSFPAGDRVQSTGGYSTYQTGPALNPAGSKVVYPEPQWLGAEDWIDIRLAGPRGDRFLYALAFTERSL
jgi:hypothetical protein